MAEPSDYSSSSEDDEYSDPLEVAASAGARLIRFLWFGLRETQSYNIDESVWYNYLYSNLNRLIYERQMSNLKPQLDDCG